MLGAVTLFASSMRLDTSRLGEEVFFGGEAVGGEDGFVECGVSVFERILAGKLPRAIDGAEAAIDFFWRFVADATDFTTGFGDRGDIFGRRRLRPRECVERGSD
jgi:hypothetical protein